LNFELLFKHLVKVVLTKKILFVYLNTKKEAYEINKALQEVKQGKTNDIEKLEDTTITTQELADFLNITQKAIEWQIQKLKKEGILRRVGAKKGGVWEVLDVK